jgi:RimJ/RimL family protein N-acetyltransferase
MTQILRTDRLIIREFSEDDVEFVVRLLNEDSFLRFIGDKGVRSNEDATNYLKNGPIASYVENGYGLFHVSLSKSNLPIGMCGLIMRMGEEYPDIGFAFLNEYQKNGYAHEAANAILNYGYTQLQLDPIVAFVNPDNERSIDLLERLGMTYAGLVEVSGISDMQRCYSTSRTE